MLDLGEARTLLLDYGAVKFLGLALMILISSIVGASAYGVKKGYYGKSRFVFKFKKNFEDRITNSSKKMYVYVEVVEIRPDGIEKRRPDLTRYVEIYCENRGIEVGHTLMNGYYAEAEVELNTEQVEVGRSSVDIIVEYRGGGGVFRNKIEFDIQPGKY